MPSPTTLALLVALGAPIDFSPQPPGDEPPAEPVDDGEAPGDPAPAATDDVDAPEPTAEADAAPTPTPARLRGRVLTFGEREPISGARLIFEGGHDAVEAADDGTFSVDLPPGDHRIIVRAVGFEDLRSNIHLEANQNLELEYRLDKTLEGMGYRTVVEAEREVAVSSTRLRDEEIRAVPGSRGDPLAVIKSMPGVSQLAGFLPYAVVRGAAPGNTGYYLDGSRVPILFHVAIGPSVIHPYFIDSVDFYPSGAPVRLGRYASGMVEARTVPARRDRVHGDIDLRLTDAGGLLEIPIDRRVLPGCEEIKRRRARCKKGPARGALTLAGRYSYTAAVIALAQANVRIAFWDYQARFDHKLGDKFNFTAFAYGSFDDLGLKEAENEDGETFRPDPFLRFQFHRIDTRLRQELPNEGSAVYAVVLGLDEAGLATGGFEVSEPSPGARTNEWRVAPRIDFHVPVGDHTAVNFGLDQEFQFFRLDNPLSELSDLGGIEDLALLFSERNVYGTGLYFDVAHQRERFEIRPGVRTDFYVQHGSSPYLLGARGISHAVGVDPRLLLREKVAARWWLKQSLGVYHQPPSFPIPIPGIESFGFERGLQRNTQGSFGYEVNLVDDMLSLNQEAYLGHLTNLQDYELSAAGDEDAQVGELEDVLAQIDGWAYGLETMLKLDPSLRMFGWAAYTLSRSTRNFVAGPAPSNWDQRHIFNVVLGYKISQKWNVGGRIHYHTGRPWTSPQTGQDALTALTSNRNNARLPPFFQLDLRVERVWRWPDWQLAASLDVTNATYSEEVFLCTPQAEEDTTASGQTLRMYALAARTQAQAAGIAGCSAQGFRYVVPSLGLRARW